MSETYLVAFYQAGCCLARAQLDQWPETSRDLPRRMRILLQRYHRLHYAIEPARPDLASQWQRMDETAARSFQRGGGDIMSKAYYARTASEGAE